MSKKEQIEVEVVEEIEKENVLVKAAKSLTSVGKKIGEGTKKIYKKVQPGVEQGLRTAKAFVIDPLVAPIKGSIDANKKRKEGLTIKDEIEQFNADNEKKTYENCKKFVEVYEEKNLKK